MIPQPHKSTLFPYTTLFRSGEVATPVNCVRRNGWLTAVGLPALVIRQHSPATAESTIGASPQDRKSTRLNSSHSQISYAVFCLKKKKNTIKPLDSQQ